MLFCVLSSSAPALSSPQTLQGQLYSEEACAAFSTRVFLLVPRAPHSFPLGYFESYTLYYLHSSAYHRPFSALLNQWGRRKPAKPNAFQETKVSRCYGWPPQPLYYFHCYFIIVILLLLWIMVCTSVFSDALRRPLWKGCATPRGVVTHRLRTAVLTNA